MHKQIIPCNYFKFLKQGLRTSENAQLSIEYIFTLTVADFALCISILLFCSGDNHLNPGPTSLSSASSPSSMSTNIFNSLNLNHYLSFVHYNVQSISNKLDILHVELLEFDILAFTETWLSPNILTDDLLLQSFNSPEGNDRIGDVHGGVIVNVKEEIPYKRRKDLEIRGTECVWLEILNNKKQIFLFLSTGHHTPMQNTSESIIPLSYIWYP